MALIAPVVQGAQHTLYVQITGEPDRSPFVTHGNAAVSGVGKFTFDDTTSTMDWDIQLSSNDYAVTQAHFYNINPESGRYKHSGESIFCWGGRWSSHDFLSGSGFGVHSTHLAEVLDRPQDWMLIVHTEGGHFANDGGGLVEYNAAAHETNDIGVTESGNWFNNRIGKTLGDSILRDDNPHYSADNSFFGNAHFERESDAPFADALGNDWLEADGSGGWQLTADAIAAGYDLETEYLFYRYADDGNSWDYGGSEGAAGGVLQFQPVPEPGTMVTLMMGGVLFARRRVRRCL